MDAFPARVGEPIAILSFRRVTPSGGSGHPPVRTHRAGRREAGDTLAPAMGRVQVLPPVLAHGDTQARSVLVLAGALIGVATWLVLVRHPRWGGAATAGSAALLAFASVRASVSPDRVLRFLDSALDRAFDGSILPAIALAMRHDDM